MYRIRGRSWLLLWKRAGCFLLGLVGVAAGTGQELVLWGFLLHGWLVGVLYSSVCLGSESV